MPRAASPKTSAPSPAPTRRAATGPCPELRLRMRVTVGELNAIGPGKVALLEAVDASEIGVKS